MFVFYRPLFHSHWLVPHLFERWVGWFSTESAVYKVRLLILQELLVIEQQIPEGKGKELLDLHVISSRRSSSSR